MSEGRKCVEILREIEETLRRDYDPRLPFVKQFHDWIREKLKLAEAALRAETPPREQLELRLGVERIIEKWNDGKNDTRSTLILFELSKALRAAGEPEQAK